MKKVYVCCPGGVVTGGPELLHQFVHELRDNGVDAHIVYMPFNKSFDVPEQYKNYNVSVADYNSTSFSTAVVVLPEVNTGMANKFEGAQIVIWWLSVDFYFSYSGNRPVKEFIYDKINLLLGRRLPILKLKKFSHYVQSEYAHQFLKGHHIESKMLTDYIGHTHLNGINFSEDIPNRERIIAFNPKKGIPFTQKLINKNNDIKFVPLINMTPLEVRKLLLRAMIYIDFGNHPGKDRFPREAAMAGCCIITGIKGSAGNEYDVSIPSKYKLNEEGDDAFVKFKMLVDDIFSDFTSNSVEFDDYRKKIKNEPSCFKKQVLNFIKIELLGN
ncbi:hypothetical protein [Aeromonas caviae]|uniref:hypothetical protein n=1 Tax=Aeromonas caviae TaxID=648 RepID=UPI00398A26A9